MTRLILGGSLLCLLPVAAADLIKTRTLFDDKVEVWPSRIRTLDIPGIVAGARITCTYTVARGDAAVRVLLINRSDAERFAAGQPYRALAATEFDDSGAFSSYIEGKGNYRLVIDNHLTGRAPAEVELRVLLFTGQSAPQRPSLAARLWLIWGSLALFVAGGTYAAMGIRRAIETRTASGI
jgi:hypothetical protein